MSRHFYVFYLALIFFAAACGKANDYSNRTGEVIREWKDTLTSANENHATKGIANAASFHLLLNSDNSLRFDINIDSLQKASDRIMQVQINLGDPVTDGALIIDLPIRISSSYIESVVYGLRQSFVDSLLDNTIDKYVNVLTANSPAGLVRGPLNTKVLFSATVPLSGSNVVPAVTTSIKGTAYLKVTSGNILYSRVNVDNDVADPPVAATVNPGAAGTNGAAFLTLASSAADFGTSKKTPLSVADYTTLTSSNSYVLVSSSAQPAGKLRGQVR